MSEMIERCARAMVESTSGPWEKLSREGQEAARCEVRAVLAALREPTPGMCAAAKTFTGVYAGVYHTAWQAMIDAALESRP